VCEPPQVGYIAALQTSGKLAPEDAYYQLKALWKQLKYSKKELGIGAEAPTNIQDI
jgi:hypothetical protein